MHQFIDALNTVYVKLEQNVCLLTFETHQIQTTKCPIHECNKKQMINCFRFKMTKVTCRTFYFILYNRLFVARKSHCDFRLTL